MRVRIWALTSIALLIGACGQPTAISGPLMVREDGSCIYVQGPYADYTDQYWIGSLPAGYSAGPAGIVSPAGTVLVDGQSVTVNGRVSGGPPGDTACVSVHTLDVTSIR